VQKPRGAEEAQEMFQRRELEIPRGQAQEEKLGEVYCSKVKHTCYCRGLLQLTVSMEQLTKEEVKMTRDSQMKDSEESHNQIRESAKEVGRNKISNEEFDREIVELKEQLSVMMKLLQEKVKEDQRYGWNLKKKVKWPIVQLYVRKLRQRLKHRLNAWIREEELREAEYRESLEAGQQFTFVNQRRE
jgi:hypothetical protein